ncbi:hypothetical protein GCM10010103_75660 [Streptomyces paradoxus]|uniref:DnaJ-class molecular chaperone n=1 Tax=Streptomyces paradoxus TaxID=66375 RepID=A0A7W9TJ01_9ACTN|nr:hypothetical protein [Streptomyces paradoxus]MBB6081625.1 DnaJ-class molecular chaperone [Streptomyces paradoxus]
MELVPGEYEFTCTDCHGDGSVQVLRGIIDEATDEPDHYWDKCDDCRGQGTVCVDEEEAAEKIEYGQTPLRTPSA